MKKRSLKLLILLVINVMPVLGEAQVWDSLSTDIRSNSGYNKVHNGKLLVGIRDTEMGFLKI